MLDEQAGFYPTQVYVEDGRRHGVQIGTPDVNHSEERITARGRRLRLGLAAVKGLRMETQTGILAARQTGGAFVSVADFVRRVAVHKREVEALIHVGAFDGLAPGRPRTELLWQAYLVLADQQQSAARSDGQGKLPFQESRGALEALIPAGRHHTRQEILRLERAALGFTLSGHPLEPYAAALSRLGATPVERLAAEVGQPAAVAGWPVAARRHLTKTGGWMLYLTLLEGTGMVEVVVMPDRYNAVLPALAHTGPLVARGHVELPSHGGAVLRATELFPLREPESGRS